MHITQQLVSRRNPLQGKLLAVNGYDTESAMQTSSGILLAGAIPEQPKRRRIPTWLRVSAAAGLGLVVLLILGGVWLVGYVKRMSDPQVQWAAVREVIAVDEPPPPYRMLGLPEMDGMRVWGITDGAGKQRAMLYHRRGEGMIESWEEMLDPIAREKMGDLFDPTVAPESGTIVVQGRELRCMRFSILARKDSSDEPGTSSREKRSRPAILVDLSRAGSEESLGCMVFEDEGGRVEDAQVVEFLEPFHVGTDR